MVFATDVTVAHGNGVDYISIWSLSLTSEVPMALTTGELIGIIINDNWAK